MFGNHLHRRLLAALAVLALAPWLQGGCGGGGGGGGGGTSTAGTDQPPPASLTVQNAADVSGVLDFLWAVTDAASFSSGSDTATASSAEEISLFQALQGLLERAASEAGAGPVRSLASDTVTGMDCMQGGTMDTSLTWNGPENPIECGDMQDLSMEITMHGCTELDLTMDGTMTVTVPGSSCGLFDGAPDSMNLALDLTMKDTVEGWSATFQGFTMDAHGITWNGLDITSMTATMDGTLSWSDGGDSGEVSMDGVTTTLETVSDPVYGSLYKTSVEGWITTACLDGWVEVHTTEPVRIPMDFSCPVGGSWSVRGGDTTARISYDGGGGMTVEINGSQETYSSCDQAPACS